MLDKLLNNPRVVELLAAIIASLLATISTAVAALFMRAARALRKRYEEEKQKNAAYALGLGVVTLAVEQLADKSSQTSHIATPEDAKKLIKEILPTGTPAGDIVHAAAKSAEDTVKTGGTVEIGKMTKL